MSRVARWERLEDYLMAKQSQGGEFTAVQYASDTGMDTEDATLDIQSYLRAQRARPYKIDTKDGPVIRGGSKTLFVIHRVPTTRTSKARWAVGVKTRDAVAVGNGFSDDVKARALRAFTPDLLRIGEKNPRAKRRIEAQINGVIEHAVGLLELAAQGVYQGDED